MKIFYSEYLAQYASYTFSYAVYCLKEKDEELPLILEKGFLPYTNDLTIKKDVFYLARSVRISLENFKDTSENKRVDRKIKPLNIELKVLKKEAKAAVGDEPIRAANNRVAQVEQAIASARTMAGESKKSK